MQSKILVLLVGFWISLAIAQNRCPKPNQKFNSCGSACEPTCRNPEPELCTEQCVSGCFCETGFLKNENGDCVRKENCAGVLTTTPANQCSKPHQVFRECGSACAPTCANRNPQVCTMQCIRGCFCEDGYVKNSQGDCVRPVECNIGTAGPRTTRSTQCPAGQKFNSCGSACQPTCSNPRPQICTAQCVAGCFCENGLLKDDNGNCVVEKNCPQTRTTRAVPNGGCGPNKEYTECRNPCPQTCDNLDPPMCKPLCPSPGCQCKSGFVENASGQCVLSSQCPNNSTRCGRNAEFVKCPSPCEATCDQPNKPQVCKAMCPVEGCQCKKGFIKNANGQCVSPINCDRGLSNSDSNKCGPNERWSDDSCIAPKACQQPQCPSNQPKPCPAICQVGGCVCKDGFVRDENGNCIPPGRCSKQESTTPAIKDPCTPNPCENGKRCKVQFVACLVAPCPQYVCV